jgi:hypothetical protein
MNVFVLRKAALGDLVLTLPVIEALTTIGRVSVATHPRFEVLLPPTVTAVDDAWVWARAPHHYDLAVCFSVGAANALRAAGVPEVRQVDPYPPAGVHALDHYAGVLAGLPYAWSPRVSPPPTAEGRYVVIAPGSGGAGKRWPMERWRALVAVLPAPVIWVRGPVEADEPGWPLGAVSPDAAGLVALAAASACWVGPDAGPSHLAAAVYAGQGRDLTRASVVFGPTDPAQWAPRGAKIWRWDAEPRPIVDWLSRFLPNADVP